MFHAQGVRQLAPPFDLPDRTHQLEYQQGIMQNGIGQIGCIEPFAVCFGKGKQSLDRKSHDGPGFAGEMF